MFDLDLTMDQGSASTLAQNTGKTGSLSLGHRFFKRGFDISISVILLPVLFLVCLVLMIANPFFNSGPVFFRQARMGRNCRAFRVFKFRTMRCEKVLRQADDPLEVDRITPLGHILRRSRIDELPQIINVLRGDMSLIGPRPDYFNHARRYMRTVPGYRARHAVRPGISGLAQTELGYIQGTDATVAKVRADLHYIARASIALDMWILWRTLVTVACRRGL